MTQRVSQLPHTLGSLKSTLPSPSPRHVCLQCRHRASLPKPPANRQVHLLTETPSRRRTYATESRMADRVHKRFADFMNKRMWKEGHAPTLPDESPREPGTEVQEQPQRPYQEPTTSVVDDPDYIPAVSGEGLEVIGGPEGWWEEAWDEQHQYQGFMRSTPLKKAAEIWAAMEYSLVEAVTLDQAPIRLRFLKKNRPRPLEVGAIGDFKLSQADDGKITLRWRRQEDGTELLDYLYKSVLEQENPQEPNEVVDELPLEAEAEGEMEDTTPSEQVSAMQVEDEPVQEAPANGSVFIPTKESGAKQDNGLQVVKRVMQLTGKRIPDPTIQAIESSHDLFFALLNKPKAKKLAEVLRQGSKKAPLLTRLPNVRVVPYRQKPYMAESALGRKKVIERRLDEHGIQEPFRAAMEAIESSERQRLLIERDALVEAGAEYDTTEGMMAHDTLEPEDVKQKAIELPEMNERRSVFDR
ncbi:MAG: hypothetical protein Q9216_005250 [Gyalolechia sp. 2 TL-2023]